MARYGIDGWSTWGLYIVTAFLQGLLLFMGIYFEYISPSKDVPEYEEPSQNGTADGRRHDAEPSEETPLLESR